MLGKYKRILVVFGVLVGLLTSFTANAQENYKIVDTNLDNASNLFIINGSSNAEDIKLTGGALSSPDRVFIDIHNAILATPKVQLEVNNPHIKDIKLAQFSVNPNIVRMVITADSQESLSKINVAKYNNSIALRFDEIAPRIKDSILIFKDKAYIDGASKFTKVYRKVNVVKTPQELKSSIISAQEVDGVGSDSAAKKSFFVKTINVKDGRIGILGIGEMLVRQPFVLDEPYRIVFDIVNAQVASADMLKEYDLNGKDKVRIGLFEGKDLRVVINTDEPDKYRRIMSPDMQSMIISTLDNNNFSELLDSKTKGRVDSVDVCQVDEKSTLISIKSKYPYVYDVKRTASDLELYLFNKQPMLEKLQKDIKTTAQFKGIQFENIENMQDATKLVIPIKKGLSTETRLAYDGKELKVLLTDNILSDVNIYIGNNRKIVIDPGHGGYDSGAVGAGILEKDICLDISKRVKKYLKDAGVKVVMTRVIDETLSLRKRASINNRELADAFVSIHVNASEKPAIKGLETHWYTKSSRKFAEILHSNFSMGVASPDRGLFNSRFYVINHTMVPAVLVEVGFISNEQERYQLITEMRKDDTARSIANGILMYLAAKYEKNVK